MMIVMENTVKAKNKYRVVMTPKDPAISIVIKRNYSTDQQNFYTAAYSKEQAALQMRYKHPMWKVEFVVEE